MKILTKIVDRLRVFLVILMAGFTSCDLDNDIKSLYFIGDSIIARWDVNEYFPTYEDYNLGISGSNLDYIKSLRGTQTGHIVVLMIGTNNYEWQFSDLADEFADDYVRTISELGAEHIYLYSILPRGNDEDVREMNQKLLYFNGLIESKIRESGNVTYVNVFSDFINKDFELDPALYSDRLHLSTEGYEKLSAALLEQLHR